MFFKVVLDLIKLFLIAPGTPALLFLVLNCILVRVRVELRRRFLAGRRKRGCVSCGHGMGQLV